MNKIYLLFLFYKAFSFGQITLNTSLTACYALNGNVSDLVGSLNGTLSSVTPTVDRFNNINSAYAFSGSSSSYITLPNSPLLKANQVSFSAWVRFNHVNSEQYIVFTHNGCMNYHEGYMLCINNWVPGGFRLQMAKANTSCNLAGQATLNGSQVLTAFTWYHVGFYIGQDSLKLYLNGNLESTMANSNALLYQQNANVYLGGSNIASFNRPLDGSIDNVRFYNRKLNGAEFQALYAQDPECREETVDIPSTEALNQTFTVYPVPAEEQIIIALPEDSRISTFVLLNSSGEKVREGKIREKETNPIDLSFLNSGLYLLVLKSKEQMLIKKLVKN